MSQRKVLFVTYGGGHVKMVAPVVKALSHRDRDGAAPPGRGEIQVEVLGLTTAKATLAAAGIDSFGFREFVGPEDQRALEWGRELLAANASPLITEEESIAYLGMSFADLVEELGEAEARTRYAALGRGAFCPVRTLERVLDRVRPDLVVATNSPRAEQAAILAARRRGIPSLCLVDLFAIEEIKYIGQPEYASRVCVLDEHVRSRFLAAGRRPEEVIVTGNPAFDGLASPALQQGGREIRERPEFRGRKLLLWVSQPEPARHRLTGQPGDPSLPVRVREELARIVAEHPDWHLIVRPHPSEDAAGFSSGPNVTVSTQVQPLHPLLAAVDVVICMTSTVGYEAALLGKPLVHLPLSIYREEADYTAMGLARPAPTLNDLKMALNSVLLQGWQPPVRLETAGGATQAVVRSIEEWLR